MAHSGLDCLHPRPRLAHVWAMSWPPGGLLGPLAAAEHFQLQIEVDDQGNQRISLERTS